MSEVKYSSEQLHAMSDDLVAAKGRLAEAHQELQGYVNGLVSQWESGARDAYVEKQRRWDDAIQSPDQTTGLLPIIQAVAKVVKDGAVDMATTDAQNAAKWM